MAKGKKPNGLFTARKLKLRRKEMSEMMLKKDLKHGRKRVRKLINNILED